MKDYTELEIYKMAYALTLDIYRVTAKWPREEIFGLTAQIRRSAHSVNSNICEGASRRSKADCARFISTAFSSLKETENHLKLALDLGFIDKMVSDNLLERINHLSRMMNNFIGNMRDFNNY